jgi:hypothetical protein
VKLEHPAGKHEGSRADERTGFHCLLQEGKHCAEIGLTPDECALIRRIAAPRGPSSVCFGLLAAVSRIAAILPNDLAPTNMNGPLRTLNCLPSCCGAARRTGLSCIMQHFCWLKRPCAGQNGRSI